MTLAERRRRRAALGVQEKLVSERLTAALRSIDYEQALAYQTEVDRLRDEMAALAGPIRAAYIARYGSPPL